MSQWAYQDISEAGLYINSIESESERTNERTPQSAPT